MPDYPPDPPYLGVDFAGSPEVYCFTLKELQLLYKYIEHEFISYENPELNEVVNKIQRIVKNDRR